MQKVDVQRVRRELTQRQTELRDRQSRVSRHTRHREEALPADFAEQAIELENGETLVALDNEITGQLAQIERALARLDDGSYGRCEGCGDAIGEARLEALPTTVRCIECAEEA